MFLIFPSLTHAHSAVAFIEGQMLRSVYAAWNYATQQEADAAAIEGCQAEAKSNGLPQLAPKCAVGHRQKRAGGGAVVCGERGCSYFSGYATKQAAVEAAYQDCANKQFYGNCSATDITAWWDDTGYRAPAAAAAAQQQQPAAAPEPAPVSTQKCRPPFGRLVRYSDRCVKGNCTRTFEDGCTEVFQAPYCYDTALGKWDWRPNGC